MATPSGRRRIAGRSRTTRGAGRGEPPRSAGAGAVADPPAQDADLSPAGEPGPGVRQRRVRLPARRTAIVLLSAVVVLCGGAAVGFGAAARESRSAAAENRALVDARATREVAQQTSEAIRTAFSYDHADPAATREQAQQVLIGDAVQQYNALFAQVERVSAEQGLLFSTAVRASGVTRLVEDRAELLLFVDQQGVRAGNPERRSGSAQLGISTQRVGADWKISRIEVL